MSETAFVVPTEKFYLDEIGSEEYLARIEETPSQLRFVLATDSRMHFMRPIDWRSWTDD